MKDAVLTVKPGLAQLMLILVYSVYGANAFAAGKFDPYVGPKPILIYVETDPWAMTGRGALPRIAIYENGDAIYSTSKSDSLVYRVIRLSPAELDSVRGHLAPIFANPELERSYDLFPWADDRPSTLLYMCTEDTSRTVVIRGLTCRGMMRSGVYNPDSTYFKPAHLPVELYSLLKWLCELDLHGGKVWLPKYVEVVLWPYSYAPDSSIYWPKEWPGLTSSRAVKQGDIYSIFLDVAQLPKLRSLFASKKERGAVEIEGNKMAVSYRCAFPHEGTWVQAFVEAEKELWKKGRERQQPIYWRGEISVGMHEDTIQLLVRNRSTRPALVPVSPIAYRFVADSTLRPDPITPHFYGVDVVAQPSNMKHGSMGQFHPPLLSYTVNLAWIAPNDSTRLSVVVPSWKQYGGGDSTSRYLSLTLRAMAIDPGAASKIRRRLDSMAVDCRDTLVKISASDSPDFISIYTQKSSAQTWCVERSTLDALMAIHDKVPISTIIRYPKTVEARR